ncbi:hypothetical protein ACVJGD_008273 [Bradyrhizobium sp. USDA 10063]
MATDCPGAEKSSQLYTEHRPRRMGIAATSFSGLLKVDRAGSTRQASHGSRTLMLPINLGLVLPTLSISAAYPCRIEPTLDFALASRRMKSRLLQVPNSSATWPNQVDVRRSHIVRKK